MRAVYGSVLCKCLFLRTEPGKMEKLLLLCCKLAKLVEPAQEERRRRTAVK